MKATGNAGDASHAVKSHVSPDADWPVRSSLERGAADVPVSVPVPLDTVVEPCLVVYENVPLKWPRLSTVPLKDPVVFKPAVNG